MTPFALQASRWIAKYGLGREVYEYECLKSITA